VKPTRLSVLALVAVVAGAVGYVLTSAFYNDLPPLPLYAPIFLAVLAAAEGYTAATTAARLAGRPGTQPIHPLTVARIAALAKATSPVAALAAGAYAGCLAYVAQLSGPHARDDLRTAAFGVAASVLLTVAALAMERVCRVKTPKTPREDR
jgi:drug/metabolite transporter (DMT)-like permease